MDGITHRREVGRLSKAHAPDNRRPAVNADADLERPRQFLGQVLAERVDSPHDPTRRREGSPASLIGGSSNTEERHDTITGELIGNPAGLSDCVPDCLNVAV